MAHLANSSITFKAPKSVYGSGDWEAVYKAQDKGLADLMAVSRALPKGEVKEAVVAIPWADGAAYYLVTKAKPLTLAHIEVGDAWKVPVFMIRGLTLKDILRMKA